MYAAAQNITVAEIAAGVARATGRNVATRQMSAAEFKADTTTDREWYANWVAFFEGRIVRDVGASRELVPEAWDFDAWARETGALAKWRM
jgi:hypothetical protein